MHSVFSPEAQNISRAEKVIKAIIRAFFTDDFVIVVDALMRDACIPEEEIAPRLKLSRVTVQSVIAKLVEHHVVSKELVTLPNKGGIISYCYIDYQHCIDVIRYRLHLIRKFLKRQANKSYEVDKLQCPTCRKEYTILEAIPMQCKDGYFACSNCWLYDDFISMPSDARSRLSPMDTSHKLDDISELQRKFDFQMKNVIDELLLELKDKPLPRNLPSENIKHGHVKHDLSMFTERERNDIKVNYSRTAEVKGSGTGSTLGKRGLDRLLNVDDNVKVEDEIEVEIRDTNDQSSLYILSTAYEGSLSTTTPDVIDDATIPEFLRNSRVSGAKETLLKVDQLQARRSGKDSTDEVLLEDGTVFISGEMNHFEETKDDFAPLEGFAEVKDEDIQWEADPQEDNGDTLDEFENVAWES